jgi:LuxR family transcriptional regulator, maltose regulon positive regulatory protein
MWALGSTIDHSHEVVLATRMKPQSVRRRGLIQTKLSPPRMGTTLVERHRLVGSAFDIDDRARVITIIGPAGSGKSIVMDQIQQAAAALEWPTCWINLEPNDDDVTAFISYLTAALSEIDPAIGERAFSMIDSNLADGVGTAFLTICEDISRLSGAAMIFLDDFQHIANSDILDGVNRIIAAIPPELRIVISSRSQPKLELGRRQIDGTLKRIDQDQLCFSHDEAAALFSQVHKLSLSKYSVASLTTSTEGWATGLQLAGLALRRQSQNSGELIESFSGADMDLKTYLMETVFNAQSDEVQKFLLATGPLARMNVSLCQAVSQTDNCAAMLELLAKESLFLISMDREGIWFRYHHLFADFLTSELKRIDLDRFGLVCDRASKWCLEEEFFTEAVQYLLTAGRYSEASQLIASEGERVAQYQGDHRTILNWMRLLPKKYHDQHPFLKLNHAWSLMFTRSSNKALQIANGISAQLQTGRGLKWSLIETELANVACLTDLIKSISYCCGDQSDTAGRFTLWALQEWPDAQPFHRGSLNNSFAFSCIANLEFEKGLEASAKARILGLEAGADYLVAWSDWVSAILCIERGELTRAEQHLTRGREGACRFMGAQSHAGAMIALLRAKISCDRNEVNLAAEHLSNSASFASIYGPLEPLLILQKTQARVLVAQGKVGDALDLLRNGQELGLTSEIPRLAIFLAAEELKIQIREQNMDAAYDLGRRSGFLGNASAYFVEDNRKVTHDLRREMQARLMLVKQELSNAVSLLTGLISRAKADGRGRKLIELLILRSVSLWQQGREREAMRDLAVATASAAPERLAALFLEAGPVVGDILDAMLTHRSGADLGQLSKTISFERKVLNIFQNNDSTRTVDEECADADIILEPLTPREHELLKLVGAGLGNKQLADTLLISIPTVKWHLHNIFEKIDVKSRTAAIARARRLGIVK